MPADRQLPPMRLPGSRDVVLGWSALAAGASAVVACASCCVLPSLFALGGVAFAGTEVLAGWRTWLTLAAAVLVGAGWWAWRRRHQACAADPTCPLPSRWSLALLSCATIFVLAALAWGPWIQPQVLALLAAARR